jgi:hypothetical protein
MDAADCSADMAPLAVSGSTRPSTTALAILAAAAPASAGERIGPTLEMITQLDCHEVYHAGCLTYPS